MTTFYKNFDKLCKEQGTTVTGLLKQLGISTSKATAWKNGSMPKSPMMQTLADALGVTVSDFFVEVPQEKENATIADKLKGMNLFSVSERDLQRMISEAVETALAKSVPTSPISKEAIEAATERTIKKPSASFSTELSDRLVGLSEEKQRALVAAIDDLTRRGLL